MFRSCTARCQRGDVSRSSLGSVDHGNARAWELGAAVATGAGAVNHGREVIVLPGADLTHKCLRRCRSRGVRRCARFPLVPRWSSRVEEAFSEAFEPSTCELSLRQGFYGLAEGAAGASRLAAQMESLINDTRSSGSACSLRARNGHQTL